MDEWGGRPVDSADSTAGGADSRSVDYYLIFADPRPMFLFCCAAAAK